MIPIEGIFDFIKHFNELVEAVKNIKDLKDFIDPEKNPIQSELKKIDNDLKQGLAEVTSAVKLGNDEQEWKNTRDKLTSLYNYTSNALSLLNSIDKSKLEKGKNFELDTSSRGKIEFSDWCLDKDLGFFHQLEKHLKDLHDEMKTDSGSTLSIYASIINQCQNLDSTDGNAGGLNLHSNLQWNSMMHFMKNLFKLIVSSAYAYELAFKLLSSLEIPKVKNNFDLKSLHKDVKKYFGDINTDGVIWYYFGTVFNGYLKPYIAYDQLKITSYIPDTGNNAWPFIKSWSSRVWVMGTEVNLLDTYKDSFFTSIEFYLPEWYGITPRAQSPLTVASGEDEVPAYAVVGLRGTVAQMNEKYEVVPSSVHFPDDSTFCNTNNWVEQGRHMDDWVPINYAPIKNVLSGFPEQPEPSSSNHMVVVTGFQLQTQTDPMDPSMFNIVVAVQFGEIDMSQNVTSGMRKVSPLSSGNFIAPIQPTKPTSESESLQAAKLISLGKAGKTVDTTCSAFDASIVTNISLGVLASGENSFTVPIAQCAPQFQNLDFIQPSKIFKDSSSS